jgi:hypothetical protein
MQTITGFVSLKNGELCLDGRLHTRAEDGTTGDVFQKMYEGLSMNYPKFYKMDAMSQAGILATEVLLSAHSVKQYLPAEVGLILSSDQGSIDTDRKYMSASMTVPSPALFVYTLPNIVAGEICIRHTLKGENAFFMTATFDAELLSNYVSQVFLQSSVKACITGWVNVANGHHEVLVYLVEKQGGGINLPHTAEQLNLLYQ